MPITATGQIYTPQNAAEIRDQFLRDIRLGALDFGLDEPPVTPGTDWFLLGTSVANIALIGFANVTIGLDAQNILTAVGDDLDQIRIAYGLPEVAPTPSTGKIKIRVDGSVTVNDGEGFLLPNGLRGEVVGTYVDPADNAELDVTCIDTGEGTNLGASETVRFTSPPVNLRTEATVSDGSPLTGGTDAEDDERKRDRILNVLRNKPSGGNWSYIRDVALAALGSVQDCYVYPALGGPGSAKVVVVKDFDEDQANFSRELSTSALATVEAAIQAAMPIPQEIVVDTAADQTCDVTLQVTLPASSLSGGNGLGWVDSQPWPPLVGGDSGTIAISSVAAGNDVITVDAATTTAPINGQTHIAWWSRVDQKFYTALVLSHSGATTAWVLTLDRALVSSDGTGPSIANGGDFISPAAVNMESYSTEWRGLFRSLGPGENTSDANVIPRALRHPFVVSEDPSDITTKTISTWVNKFSEITAYTIASAPTTTPTVPSLRATPPNVLVPRKFAIYKT